MVDPNFGIGRRKFRPAAELWPLFMPGAWCGNKKIQVMIYIPASAVRILWHGTFLLGG